MIDFDLFLSWCHEHFDDVIVSGDEIKLNSIFCEDVKHHLSVNPKKNAYQCWKSQKSGNVVNLVSHVCKCDYTEARDILKMENHLRALEDRVNKMLEEKGKREEARMSLPPNTFPISSLPHTTRHRAEKYLNDRGIPVGRLMFCIGGKLGERLVIPYYDRQGSLIYWNARDITGRRNPRYVGPDFKEVGVGKGDVIYMNFWPKEGERIHLTEGEFDAISLGLCGMNGAACGGKNVSDRQIDILKNYKICMCFDGDKSGEDALNKMGDKLLGSGMKDITYVRPPVGVKDWNAMLVDFGAKVVGMYVKTQEKPFTPWTSNTLRITKR